MCTMKFSTSFLSPLINILVSWQRALNTLEHSLNPSQFHIVETCTIQAHKFYFKTPSKYVLIVKKNLIKARMLSSSSMKDLLNESEQGDPIIWDCD